MVKDRSPIKLNKLPARQPSDAEEARRFAALADAENTQRAYSADWRHFLTWCRNRNRAPLPADADHVAMYLRYCAEQLRLKVSTVARRMAAIAEAHNRSGNHNPCAEWVVRSTMRRLRRELGKPPAAKTPILVDDLKKMLALCPPSLAGLRDRAILLVGFTGAFRRSDLVNLDVDDISRADEGLVLMIRRGKTDQARSGRKIGIPFGKDAATCAVTALLRWLEAAEITSGPIFRGVTKFDSPRPTRLSDRVVADIVKRYSAILGKGIEIFSGHSLRAGFATAAAIAGASERSIQKQTGHVSLAMLRRYIREAELFRENAAAKLEL